MKFDRTMRFEIKALAHYRLSGMLAPGKDQPAGVAVDENLRRQKWELFNKWDGRLIDAVLNAIEELTEAQ